MMKNTKLILGIFLIFFLLITLTSINATSENKTQKTFSDVSTPLKSDLNTGNIEQTRTSTHVLNTSSFNDYVSDGKFNDKVSDGDTIDIQGKLDNPRYALNINKQVNIISSTRDAYIDLDTISMGTNGDYSNGIFQVTSGSSGTNITGITFHNTRVWVKDTNNVHIDNITVLCEKNTGSGVGSFSVRGNSNNITVTNSYFKTIHNGGHSNVVVAGATNCLFENNTVEAWGTEGNVGNTFYLTTYGGSTNTNITIRNNTIRSIKPSPGICWGLVLEGKGHVIENNYINASAAVVAQYADAEYGVVTDLDGIIFRNNYVAYGGPRLTFPGEAYNNTINGPVTLANIKAYNNTLENVTINNTVLFENNTAKKITIIGENNTLNNNEVYSTEDYAIIIDGKNNTLTNNKFLSNNGYGEDSISNSTEYISINNSERLPRVFYINDDNINEYFDDVSSATSHILRRIYAIKDDVISDGDILVLDLSPKAITLKGQTTSVVRNLVIKDSTLDGIVWPAYNLDGNISIINSRVLCVFSRTGYTLNVINSTIKNYNNYEFSGENYVVLYNDYGKRGTDVPVNNTYLLSSYSAYSFSTGKPRTIFDDNGHINPNVDAFSKIVVVNFDDSDKELYASSGKISPYLDEVYLDKPLNFTAMYDDRGNIASDVHLMEGSEQTFFEGIKFDGNVLFETGNIEFYNCTFNQDLIINQSTLIFDGCTFNGKVTLNSSNNNIFNNNIFNSTDSIKIFNSRSNTFENNTINTAGDYAIVFDDESGNNIVRYNTLVAASSFGDYSAVGGDNTVEDNTPAYNTQIIIGADSQYFADETPEVTITVNDIVNNLLVTKGYVEVYYDGYFIAKKDLVNGQASVTLPSYNIGNYPLKVWYYDGLKYNDNVTKVNVNLVKSNVSITVNEFTAKLNEKATITTTFLNNNGNPVMDTNVTFSVGRSTYTVETVNGIATLDELVTKEWLDAGKITVSFPSTDAYNSNTTTINMNTSKDDVLVTPTVNVENDVADVDLTLSDALGENVTDGRIVLSTLDGQELASGRVSNGKFISNVALPEGYTDEYLVANFTGSYYYNDFVRNVKITQMLNSTISLETNSPLYGEELVINGKLVDSKNTPIGGANLTLNLNGSKVIVTTNDDGEYNYTYTPGLGVNSLTVTFDGTVDVYGSSASKDVTIRDTDREMNEVLDRLDELQKENEKLQEQLAALEEQNNKTQEQLDNITGQNNVTQDQLNNLTQQNKDLQDQIAALTEMIAALTSAENTTIVFDSLGTVKYNDVVTISGVVSVESGASLSNQFVTLTFNDESVDVKVVNGVFEYNVTVKDIGEQVVTAVYAGNSKYQSSSNSTSFYVQKKPVLYFYKVENTTEDNTVTVSGKLLNNGKAIKGATITLNVNGKDVTVTPNNDGYFKYSFKAVAGENVVTASYAGTTEYAEANATTSVYALMKTTLYAYKIENANTQDSIKVSGKLLNKGKAVVGETVTINVNGKSYTATTNKDGYFQVNIKLAAVGENNLTVSYAGSDVYVAAEYNSTFVTKAKTNVYAYSIADSVVGKTVKVNGKLLTGSTPCSDREVLINVDGEIFKVKTNFEGYYQYDLKQVSMGTHNVTVSFAGDDEYLSSTFNTSFIAKSE